MTTTQPPRRRSSKLTLSRLTDVVDHFGEAFVLWDADDRLVLCNRKYREFFALSAELMTSGNSFEQILRGAAARGQYVDAHIDPEGWIQERLRRRRAAAGSFELELSDGRCLHVTNRRTSDGGIVGILSDITERKKGELELRAANSSLKAAMEKLASTERLATIGQVAATVSHELRNPLGAIRNSMALVHQLTAGKQLGVERALERVDRNIERCTAIITALLEFTREKEITRTPMALDTWLADLLTRYPAPEGIAIEHDLRAGAEVAIDPEWFRHAVVNLVDNGIQALQDPAWRPPAGHVRRITARTESAGPHVRLTISDTGPGIPADVLPRIFEPLFTTKGFGVGLGLPTVRQIVEKHGGTIDVDSSIGGGTAVMIRLPHRTDSQPTARDAAA
jgi:PAS domain S-box-containing protein